MKATVWAVVGAVGLIALAGCSQTDGRPLREPHLVVEPSSPAPATGQIDVAFSGPQEPATANNSQSPQNSPPIDVPPVPTAAGGQTVIVPAEAPEGSQEIAAVPAAPAVVPAEAAIAPATVYVPVVVEEPIFVDPIAPAPVIVYDDGPAYGTVIVIHDHWHISYPLPRHHRDGDGRHDGQGDPNHRDGRRDPNQAPRDRHGNPGTGARDGNSIHVKPTDRPAVPTLPAILTPPKAISLNTQPIRSNSARAVSGGIPSANATSKNKLSDPQTGAPAVNPAPSAKTPTVKMTPINGDSARSDTPRTHISWPTASTVANPADVKSAPSPATGTNVLVISGRSARPAMAAPAARTTWGVQFTTISTSAAPAAPAMAAPKLAAAPIAAPHAPTAQGTAATAARAAAPAAAPLAAPHASAAPVMASPAAPAAHSGGPAAQTGIGFAPSAPHAAANFAAAAPAPAARESAPARASWSAAGPAPVQNSAPPAAQPQAAAPSRGGNSQGGGADTGGDSGARRHSQR